MSRILLKSAANEAPVEVRTEQAPGDRTAYVVHVGERASEVECRLRGDGEGWLQTHGRVVPFHVVHRGTQAEVWLEGRRFLLEHLQAGPRRGAAPPPPSAEVKAPMPGTIMRILAKPGDPVQAHQPLVVMESMKMEMTLSASREGRVAEVRCREGELVAMNAVLIRFADDDPRESPESGGPR